MLDASHIETTVSQLQAVVDEIEAGRIEASPTERAYLAGALESLQEILRLARSSE